MADVWNDITKILYEAVDYTAKEAEKLTGVAKIKYKLINLNSKKSSLYEEIGKLRYEELRSVPTQDGVIDNTVEIAGLCDAVAALDKDIKAAYEELTALKQEKTCASCGAKIKKDMAYCPRCGRKQDN